MNTIMRTTKRVRGSGIVVALLTTLFIARSAHAHPIHTTLTKVTVEARSVTFNVRTFADDFSATVALLAGRKAPADSSAPVADVIRYAQKFFTVTGEDGKPVVLESCGIKRANELYWLCFRAVLPAGIKGVRMRNQMLTELHADQVNIVQMEPPAARRTILFTKGSAPAAIAG